MSPSAPPQAFFAQRHPPLTPSFIPSTLAQMNAFRQRRSAYLFYCKKIKSVGLFISARLLPAAKPHEKCGRLNKAMKRSLGATLTGICLDARNPAPLHNHRTPPLAAVSPRLHQHGNEPCLRRRALCCPLHGAIAAAFGRDHRHTRALAAVRVPELPAVHKRFIIL